MRVHRIGWVLLMLPVVYVSSCTYTSITGNRAYERLQVGDSKDTVIRLFGARFVRETDDHPFTKYDNRQCQSPCVERLWFENKLAFYEEAWSVDLDKAGVVLDKGSYTMP
ncbi:hypothetical protein EC912_11110 [Luteibacter rhizovicinus]|uniref:Uncharacterized protein n=1 Tax=Luteibacter rhizovicinus TaxID=242606 RepID=A0A4R3YGN2_9GAMM|nr:hypothetical protein [Luteibacter rhizovicinus]TCV91417.1 hypothetical protein EC912_11110 [Luteibacter rhizovicinus]